MLKEIIHEDTIKTMRKMKIRRNVHFGERINQLAKEKTDARIFQLKDTVAQMVARERDKTLYYENELRVAKEDVEKFKREVAKLSRQSDEYKNRIISLRREITEMHYKYQTQSTPIHKFYNVKEQQKQQKYYELYDSTKLSQKVFRRRRKRF